MDQLELADRFDAQRPRLLGIAYRILGSLTEAEDAVQET
jgi:DNA-directed RNA polymerase specialized sigma24 family protein